MILENKFYNFIIILQIILILPSVFSLYDKCYNNGITGICIDENECVNTYHGNKSIGNCPHDQNPVKCCDTIKCSFKDNQGITKNGICTFNDECDGTSYPNKGCPGNSSFTCCIPNKQTTITTTTTKKQTTKTTTTKSTTLLPSPVTYNYRVGQRDLTFVIKIKNNKVLKVIGYLGYIYQESIIAKVAKMLTTDSLLYDAFSIIGFKHVSFEIGSNVFDKNAYSDVYEYTEYDDQLGVYRWQNAKKWNVPDGFFQYNLMDWESLSKYQGNTNISPAELNELIDRKRFPTEEFKLTHIFSNGKYQSYDLFRNNCHDFVQHCLELVGFPDTSKFITFKTEPRKILQKRIDNISVDWVRNLIKSLENKTCDLLTASNIENYNNTISIYNNLINTYGYKDDSEDCHTLIDESLLNTSNDLNSNINNGTIPDNNLNSSGDSEKPKDDNSGANNFKQFSFLSILIIFTSILIWQTHIIF